MNAFDRFCIRLQNHQNVTVAMLDTRLESQRRKEQQVG